ncbi:MAG: hypothetical protein Q8O31_07465 [Rhodocyclaceae bacterium]|nr:hypothetical protein [Rhodocyclaceae bacterium]
MAQKQWPEIEEGSNNQTAGPQKKVAPRKMKAKTTGGSDRYFETKWNRRATAEKRTRNHDQGDYLVSGKMVQIQNETPKTEKRMLTMGVFFP